MGKRIIQQARGHGSSTYRVRKKSYVYRIKYPRIEGEAEIIKLVPSRGHTAPLAKVKINNKDKEEIFYVPAFEKAYVGQKIMISDRNNKDVEIKTGNIVNVGRLEIGTKIYNIEKKPGDGGKMMRAGGTSAVVIKKFNKKVYIKMPSKKEVELNPLCRAQIGISAGTGRKDKPVMKAGKKYFIKKAKGKLWPRTSAVAMNAIDHPFGSGRGKRLTHGKKGKIAKRNAPPGARVGLIRPRRTGRKKR